MGKCSEKCEIYSRVTGYYRPVSNWNKGKQAEFKDRKMFEVEKKCPKKIITANRPLTCDLCGHAIPQGSKCRLIRDDFMPSLIYFEHLNCPSGPAIVRPNYTPNKPVNSNRQPLPALA